jgi:5-methylcytosine-specific restriction endonuclease McrA
MPKGIYRHKPQQGYQKNHKFCGVISKSTQFKKGHKSYITEETKIKMRKSYNNLFCPINLPIGISYSYTKEYKRLVRKRYKYSRKMAGELSIDTIQRVYEDNIKRFGTLTCYLCKNPIEIGSDSLEHKIPLSRGGTNNYENLDIAHRRCNSRKHNLTEEEYLIKINGGKIKK